MNNEVPESCPTAEDEDREGEEHKLETVKVTQEDSFTVVKARKTRRKPKGKVADFQHDISSNCNNSEREETETKAEVLRKINNCTSHLRASEYYSKFLEKLTVELPKVEGASLEKLAIFCMGLGPISSHLLSRISRYQLALLILLKEEFHAPVEVFDPIFSAQEKSILSVELGFEVSEVNEEGKRVVENPTLLFMPHCPHQLVNNLLYANWSPERLKNCYIVCNSLSEANSTIPIKYLDKHLYYLPKAHSICTEIPLPNIFTDHPDVFNDISLHVFPSNNFTKVEEDFWLDKPCPIYAEEDFISGENKR